jgi:mono/diheme cytochrome c family protein
VSTLLFVLLFLVLGLGVVLVAMRSGSKGPVLDSDKRGSRRALGWGLGVLVLAFVVAVPLAVAIDNVNTAEENAGPVRLNAEEKEGRHVFNQRCVQCHTLGASNGVQTVGPNLDELRPPKELILDAIEKGRAGGQGQMPSLLVTGPEAEHVAAYVARVAGRTGE